MATQVYLIVYVLMFVAAMRLCRPPVPHRRGATRGSTPAAFPQDALGKRSIGPADSGDLAMNPWISGGK
jgi:hypothetical protein